MFSFFNDVTVYFDILGNKQLDEEIDTTLTPVCHI